MEASTLLEQIAFLVIAAGLGFLAKVFYDWLDTRGKDTTELLMSKVSCRANRDDCGFKQFKDEYTAHREGVIHHTAKIDQQLKNIDKTLTANTQDVKDLRTDIKEVKEQLTTVATLLNAARKRVRYSDE